TNLFFPGIRPAVNVGLSVSRGGSAPQITAMKQGAGSTKGGPGQYRELAASAPFRPAVDAAPQRLLHRGARPPAQPTQPQCSPLKTEEQVAVIFAGGQGYLDKLALSDVTRFEQGLLAHMRTEGKEVLEAIRTEKALSDELREKLKAQIDAFAKNFA